MSTELPPPQGERLSFLLTSGTVSDYEHARKGARAPSRRSVASVQLPQFVVRYVELSAGDPYRHFGGMLHLADRTV